MVNFQPQLRKLVPKIAELFLGRENMRKFSLREGFRTILGGPRAPKRVPKVTKNEQKIGQKTGDFSGSFSAPFFVILGSVLRPQTAPKSIKIAPETRSGSRRRSETVFHGFLSVFGGLRTSKIKLPPTRELDFRLFAFSHSKRLSGRSWAPLGQLLARFWDQLCSNSTPIGAFLGQLGQPWSQLGTILGHLGTILGPFGNHLGTTLGQFGGFKEPFYATIKPPPPLEAEFLS